MFSLARRARNVQERWIAPDRDNRIPLACRCLLVRDEGRWILLETGIGAFFDPNLRARYGVVEPCHVLLDSLAAVGVEPGDITVIVLSHLHFDHAGGALTAWADGAPPALAFPNASYVVGEEAWQRAVSPHARDRASFIPGLTELSLTRPDVSSGSPPRRIAPSCSAPAFGSTVAPVTHLACS